MERMHHVILILIVCFLLAFTFGPSCVEAFGSGIAEIGPFGVTDLGYSGFVKGAAEFGSPEQFETLLGVPVYDQSAQSKKAPQSAHVVSSTTPVTITVQHPTVTTT